MSEQINNSCECPHSCSRHGDCETCKKYHGKIGTKTNCEKTGNEEKCKVPCTLASQ